MGQQDLSTEATDGSFFIKCEHCGKKIIKRLPNGLWHFVFGRKPSSGDFIPVELFIYGSVKIRCWHRECNKFNTLHFFPHQAHNQSETESE